MPRPGGGLSRRVLHFVIAAWSARRPRGAGGAASQPAPPFRTRRGPPASSFRPAAAGAAPAALRPVPAAPPPPPPHPPPSPGTRPPLAPALAGAETPPTAVPPRSPTGSAEPPRPPPPPGPPSRGRSCGRRGWAGSVGEAGKKPRPRHAPPPGGEAGPRPPAWPPGRPAPAAARSPRLAGPAERGCLREACPGPALPARWVLTPSLPPQGRARPALFFFPVCRGFGIRLSSAVTCRARGTRGEGRALRPAPPGLVVARCPSPGPCLTAF